MIVAFEGPDKAGKTSLLKAFREIEPYHRWPLFRMDVPPSVLYDEDGEHLEKLSRAWFIGLTTFKKHVSFLLDRCYVTSLVYSSVFGRRTDLSYVVDISRELDPIIVYVRTPLDVLIERFQREGDRMLHDTAKLIAVAAAYETWWMTNPTKNRIVTTLYGESPAAMAAEVAKAMQTHGWRR